MYLKKKNHMSVTAGQPESIELVQADNQPSKTKQTKTKSKINKTNYSSSLKLETNHLSKEWTD